MGGMADQVRVSDEEWAVWRSFIDMRRRLDLALEKQLQVDADISLPDYSVLIALWEAPDKQLRVGELSSGLVWEKSRVSHQVSRMERRGLVERRECDTDARGTWVAMTPAGSRAVLGAMREHLPALRRYFFDVVSADELSTIGAVSDRVLDAICPDADEDTAVPQPT
jgi:DNA-binding MarR family transcriptional regulator